MLTRRHAAAGSALCRGDAELAWGGVGGQHPASSPRHGSSIPAGPRPQLPPCRRGTAIGDPCPVPQAVLRQPPGQGPCSPDQGLYPKTKRADTRLAPCSQRTPTAVTPTTVTPLDLGSPTGARRAQPGPPQSFCPDGAIKSLAAIAGAPEQHGDKLAAQWRSPGRWGGMHGHPTSVVSPPPAARARHGASNR